MTVTVFTKPACVQCNATYRALDKKGIVYSSIDITTMPEVFDYLKSEFSASAAPYVVVSEGSYTFDPEEGVFSSEGVAAKEHWGGFNPGKIDELV